MCFKWKQCLTNGNIRCSLSIRPPHVTAVLRYLTHIFLFCHFFNKFAKCSDSYHGGHTSGSWAFASKQNFNTCVVQINSVADSSLVSSYQTLWIVTCRHKKTPCEQDFNPFIFFSSLFGFSQMTAFSFFPLLNFIKVTLRHHISFSEDETSAWKIRPPFISTGGNSLKNLSSSFWRKKLFGSCHIFCIQHSDGRWFSLFALTFLSSLKWSWTSSVSLYHPPRHTCNSRTRPSEEGEACNQTLLADLVSQVQRQEAASLHF